MKTLNYFLTLLCLIGVVVFTLVWINTGNGEWMLLSGTLFLFSIIFMLFSDINGKEEEIYKLRMDKYLMLQQLSNIKDTIISK